MIFPYRRWLRKLYHRSPWYHPPIRSYRTAEMMCEECFVLKPTMKCPIMKPGFAVHRQRKATIFVVEMPVDVEHLCSACRIIRRAKLKLEAQHE